MSRFFQIPVYSKEETIKHSKLIEQYLLENTHETPSFKVNNPIHTQLINECTTNLKKKLAILQSCDTRIVTGLTVGLAAFALSYIFPIAIVGIAAFAFSAYYAKAREKAAEDYRNVLENSIGCFQWALLHVPQKSEAAITTNKEVMEMAKTLSPLMNDEQRKKLIEDRIEDKFIRDAHDLAEGSDQEFAGHLLHQKNKNVYFGIYGWEQGKPVDIAKGFYFLACQGCNWIKETFQNRFGQEPARPAAASAV